MSEGSYTVEDERQDMAWKRHVRSLWLHRLREYGLTRPQRFALEVLAEEALLPGAQLTDISEDGFVRASRRRTWKHGALVPPFPGPMALPNVNMIAADALLAKGYAEVRDGERERRAVGIRSASDGMVCTRRYRITPKGRRAWQATK